MADQVRKSDVFSGDGNQLMACLEKTEVWASLKGYDGEKKALAIASRLDGAAFQVYLRLSEADQKKAETVAEQLKKEFINGETDREVAMVE